MKETSFGQLPKLKREDTAAIQNADMAIKRAVKRKRLDLVYMLKGQKYAAVKIAEGHHRFTHLTTAFAQTEYDPDELPQNPLEIKVDADIIADDTLINTTMKFLKTLPNIKHTKVNIFTNLRNYLNKKPAVTFVPSAEIAA